MILNKLFSDYILNTLFINNQLITFDKFVYFIENKKIINIDYYVFLYNIENFFLKYICINSKHSRYIYFIYKDYFYYYFNNYIIYNKLRVNYLNFNKSILYKLQYKLSNYIVFLLKKNIIKLHNGSKKYSINTIYYLFVHKVQIRNITPTLFYSFLKNTLLNYTSSKKKII